MQRLRLRQAIISLVMTYSSILLVDVAIVHATTSTQGTPSFSASQPLQINSQKTHTIGTRNLLTLNGGSSNVASMKTQRQPYAYKDHDFVIPTVKEQPRYVQRYFDSRSSQRARANTTSSVHWITLALTAVAFSKALFQRLKNPAVGAYDVDDDNGIVSEINDKEDDIDAASSSTENRSTDFTAIPPAWKEQYDHLIVEASSLREQLSMIQQMLEKQKSEPVPEVVDNNTDVQSTGTVDDAASTTAEIESLKESIQHWKKIAKVNEQKTSNAIQIERQNSIQQLEQLKMEMLQMAEHERVAMMKEFTSMIHELRESLRSQT